jgi:multiple antibiotic resistance protein
VQEFAFNAFATLLVVVDPLGLAPIYAALTRGFSEKSKRESAIRHVARVGILLRVCPRRRRLARGLGIGLRRFGSTGGGCSSCWRST